MKTARFSRRSNSGDGHYVGCGWCNRYVRDWSRHIHTHCTGRRQYLAWVSDPLMRDYEYWLKKGTPNRKRQKKR